MAWYTFSSVDRLSPMLRNLPNAELAFDIWLATPSSKWTFHDSVLPRFVNLSTTGNMWPFTVNVGMEYSFPGAGWYMTSSLSCTDGETKMVTS